MTSEGRPLPIVFKNEETGTFELHEAALAEVLLSPAIADKRVSVVAVAGAFRKGKTFLLDFLLRYCTNRNSENWLGDESSPLLGFKWCQGYKRETVGIYIWSNPFIVRRSDGEEIALILMDTQGTFDSESSMKDSTVVFALSLLVSSTLVYNLSNNIQEDDLMNLQTFTSYGLQARSDTDDSTAFQKLLFLIRDWNFPAQLQYGNEGGKKLLEERLEIKSCQDESHQDLRKDLRKCFTDINCYLMPHPGQNAIGKVGFEGRLSEIDPEFVRHLGVLLPLLLAPENLVGKKFGGQIIRAKDLFDSFKMFIETFKSSKLEEPTTMMECMARAASQAALGAAKEDYVQSMEAIVRQNQAIAMDKLKSEHEKFKRRAVDLYKEKNKFGVRSKRIFKQWEEKLVNAIEKQYQDEYFPRVCSQTAREASKKQYETAMDTFLQREAELTLDNFKDEHDKEQIRALDVYQARNVMAIDNTKIFDEHLELLLQEINETCNVQYMPRVIGQAALEACLEQYTTDIKNLIMNKKSTDKLQILEDKREEEKQKAISYFKKKNTSRGQNAALFNEYQTLLEQKIEELFEVKFLSEASSEVVRENCVKQYTDAIDSQVQNKNPPLRLEELVPEHDTQKLKAINAYHEKNDIGRKNKTVFEKNLKLLNDDIVQRYLVEYFPRVSSQTAREASRKQYKTAMDAFLQQEAELTLDNFKAVHEEEQMRAVAGYQERNVTAVKNAEIFEEHLQLLQQEIGELYETMYLPRVGSQATLAACKRQYVRAMESLIEGRASTLTLNELADFHEKEVQKAIKKFQDANEFSRNDQIIADKCKALLRK